MTNRKNKADEVAEIEIVKPLDTKILCDAKLEVVKTHVASRVDNLLARVDRLNTIQELKKVDQELEEAEIIVATAEKQIETQSVRVETLQMEDEINEKKKALQRLARFGIS